MCRLLQHQYFILIIDPQILIMSLGLREWLIIIKLIYILFQNKNNDVFSLTYLYNSLLLFINEYLLYYSYKFK